MALADVLHEVLRKLAVHLRLFTEDAGHLLDADLSLLRLKEDSIGGLAVTDEPISL